MTLTKASRTERPRLRGKLEIVPLSVVQYERMIEVGILAEDDPIELLDGYMVGLDQGLGQARPQPCVMPGDPPRLRGLLELWPLSVEQFERMIAAGILEEDDPIELLQGYLVALDRGGGPGMPPGPKHALTTNRVNREFSRRLPDPWVVSVQNPIRLGQMSIPGASSEPQPDVAVVRGPDTRFAEHIPGPEDIQLIVEVSDSSLSSDRDFKGEWYATAGILLYWIVNLVDRQLEIYSDPDPGTGKYRSREILAEDQLVVLRWEGLEPVTFAVKDFLPQKG
jgi:hypothetical protein